MAVSVTGLELVMAQIETALFASGGFLGILTPGNDPRSHDDQFHFKAKFVIDGNDHPHRRYQHAVASLPRIDRGLGP